VLLKVGDVAPCETTGRPVVVYVGQMLLEEQAGETAVHILCRTNKFSTEDNRRTGRRMHHA
jgi:hypothetical protein